MQEMTIYLEDSRRVRELESRIQSMEKENADLTAEVRKLEFWYRCESVINTELIDLCREKGVNFRPALMRRPWEGDATIPVPDGDEQPAAR